MAENPTPMDDRAALLKAALPHVPFDGWSEATLRAAADDLGLTTAEVRAICPRGAIDLASEFHRQGDAAMVARLAAADLGAMRIRERVAFAVRARIEAIGDREVARRSSTFFALPQHAAEGTRLIWNTADAIWTALGDPSDDINWYTKRATLSGVYGSTFLYWLGDTSEGAAATWAFLDRRVEDVMSFEKFKAGLRDNALLSRLMAGPNRVLSRVRAPSRRSGAGMPGHTGDRG